MLLRSEIERIIRQPDFGKKLCGGSSWFLVPLYDQVAAAAQRSSVPKQTDVASTLWSITGDSFLSLPVNLQPRAQRPEFQCRPAIYDY